MPSECQLFGTLGCHVCEVAEAELMPLVDSCGLAAISEETFQLGDVWVHDVLCETPEVTLNEQSDFAYVMGLVRQTYEYQIGGE